jgi:hypothetical protein
VPSKGEGNEEQKQEGGIWHPRGEINQEQNKKKGVASRKVSVAA